MTLEVFSRRWDHPDRYRVKRTATGWNIAHISIAGECDKAGAPYLFENLDHDSINYPADLGGYMEFLWDEADSRQMTEHDIQQRLDELGQWIQGVERSSPGGFWSSYK